MAEQCIVLGFPTAFRERFVMKAPSYQTMTREPKLHQLINNHDTSNKVTNMDSALVTVAV